jgi:opacity protein-like surface antigen
LLASGENKTHDAGKTAAHFGLGVSYRVAQSVDLRLEFDRSSKIGAATGSNATGSSGLNAVSLGIAYHF